MNYLKVHTKILLQIVKFVFCDILFHLMYCSMVYRYYYNELYKCKKKELQTLQKNMDSIKYKPSLNQANIDNAIKIHILGLYTLEYSFRVDELTGLWEHDIEYIGIKNLGTKKHSSRFIMGFGPSASGW